MTLGREEADEALRKALHDHAEAWEVLPSGVDYILNDYACIVHWQRVDSDGTSMYTTQQPGTPPAHHPIGLHYIAIDLLKGPD